MTKVVEELGIPSFKTFMAYKDVFMIDDAEMLECYRHCANIGAIGKLKNRLKIDKCLTNAIFSNGACGKWTYHPSRITTND